jgi:hypothetical protein
MIMKYLLVVLVLTAGAFAQRSLGTVSDIKSAKCVSGFSHGAACQAAIVSCPNVPDMTVTWGSVGTPKVGRIIIVGGNGATLPSGAEFAPKYIAAGFEVTQLTFAADWEDDGNLLEAACRPATVLNYFHTQTTGAYCAQGVSAGTGAIAYGMSWYGLNNTFENVEFTVGPVFSNIGEGCEVPYASPVKVTPTNGTAFEDPPQYNHEWPSVGKWTGTECLPKHGSTQQELQAWAAQSILQSGATLSYPRTSIAAWDCNNGLNPSAAESYLFFQQVTTPWALTAITGCTGAEGTSTGTTPQGVLADTALADDMLAHCTVPK